MDGSQAGIALIVELAVLDPCSSQEGPHISVLPVKDGVDAHEGRPALTAGTELVLALRIGI